jgi:hypothetical protein
METLTTDVFKTPRIIQGGGLAIPGLLRIAMYAYNDHFRQSLNNLKVVSLGTIGALQLGEQPWKS